MRIEDKYLLICLLIHVIIGIITCFIIVIVYFQGKSLEEIKKCFSEEANQAEGFFNLLVITVAWPLIVCILIWSYFLSHILPYAIAFFVCKRVNPADSMTEEEKDALFLQMLEERTRKENVK